MPSYCVYGNLGADVFNFALENQLTDEQVIKFKMSADDPPHATILFGPKLAEGAEEITDPKRSREVLGDFVDHFGVMPLPKYRIVGISYFDNEDVNVVKLDVESQEITDMHVYLRRNRDIVTDYEENFKKTGKESYALPPVKWCHITLGFVKKDVDINAVITPLMDRLRASGIMENEQTLKSVSLISAKTDKNLELF